LATQVDATHARAWADAIRRQSTMSIIRIDPHSARISASTVWTFVRVVDDDGIEGWGEATLQGEAAAIHRHVEDFAVELRTRSPQSALDVAATRGPVAATLAEAAALSAIDQALRDLQAQKRGRPLHAELGDAQRSRIPLYANINRGTVDRSPAGFARRAAEAVTSGFDAVKIAPFDGVTPAIAETAEGETLIAAGIERIAAVREAIGAHRRLLVDCHWRLTEASALRVLQALEGVGLFWFECPLPEDAQQFDALRRIRHRANALGVLTAGCESLTGLGAFQAFLDAGVYDVVMPDVKYAGGLAEMLRIAEAAATHGTLCSPHNPTGPIAHLHSVHVSALIGALPFLEFQYGESERFFDLVDGDLPDPRGGASALPSGAGLGARIAMDELSALSVFRVD
jgi:galactonate dehydratase